MNNFTFSFLLKSLARPLLLVSYLALVFCFNCFETEYIGDYYLQSIANTIDFTIDNDASSLHHDQSLFYK